MPSGVTKQAKVYVPELGGEKLENDDVAPEIAVQPEVALPCGQEAAPFATYHWKVALPKPTGCSVNDNGTTLAEHCDTCCSFTVPCHVVILKLATPLAHAAVPQADNGVTKQAQLVDEYNVGASYVFDVAPGIKVQPEVELPVGADTKPGAKYHW